MSTPPPRRHDPGRMRPGRRAPVPEPTTPAPRVTRLAGKATAWWGMVAALTALSSMVGTLVFAYFYLRMDAAQWPPAGIAPPRLLLPSVGALVLAASIAPAAWLHSAVRAGGYVRLQTGGAATVALALVFAGLQAADYAAGAPSPGEHAYGSLFFVLTAFHHLSLAAGLSMLGLVQLHAWNGGLGARERVLTVNAALFWYYVVGSWLVLYATLYLSPHLW